MNDPERICERVWRILKKVKDPEIPLISVVDLGIVRDVELGRDKRLEVRITPTYSGCPATEVIRADIASALRQAGFSALVRTVLAPPWTSDWITPEGRRALQRHGIAPPACRAAEPSQAIGAVALQPHVKCPRCASLDTEQISEFGSTACKALYRCRACLEPFDYFKPF